VMLAQTQTVHAKPKSNIFTELGNAADAGKAAGIAAFNVVNYYLVTGVVFSTAGRGSTTSSPDIVG